MHLKGVDIEVNTNLDTDEVFCFALPNTTSMKGKLREDELCKKLFVGTRERKRRTVIFMKNGRYCFTSCR